MRRSNVSLRLQPSLLEEAKRIAEAEGVALNQLINVAVAEKISALRTEDFFRERASRANVAEAEAHPSANRTAQPSGSG
jgi:HicB family